jgi:hypothetical protein
VVAVNSPLLLSGLHWHMAPKPIARTGVTTEHFTLP